MKVTLGGDRLGSGNKLQQYLHNYYRSTHNLSQKWASSMASGVLYPFLCMPAMRGDKFEIDLEAACRTIPTKGPLFGSYKMQVDVFQVPVRLYQALLHNNPASIGLKMNQVKFPLLKIGSKSYSGENKMIGGKINNSALIKYLGLSGLGHNSINSTNILERSINAIPALGYYEIFKNYYSNKQEENAYVIGVKSDLSGITKSLIDTGTAYFRTYWTLAEEDTDKYTIVPKTNNEDVLLAIEVQNNMTFEEYIDQTYITLKDSDGQYITDGKIQTLVTNGYAFATYRKSPKPGYYNVIVQFRMQPILTTWSDFNEFTYPKKTTSATNDSLQLLPFKLSNIDDMRMKLLSYHQFGSPFILSNTGDASEAGEWGQEDGDGTGLPYSTLFSIDTYDRTHNQYPLNGLMIKTYQSDIYNNWIRTEWIDGENGIAAMTAVSTSSGSFKIDALNMAEKLYDLYNRIAVSGNTYEDWQNAVYTEMPKIHIETPVYLGGMSSEVMFEEIVQTAPATEEGGDGLGTLGGRGTLLKRKGGNVHVKVAEASFIIGVVSLTPRVYYTQGNEFFLTELKSVDDFHKPALDGIGFQNLIGERLAWWDTALAAGGTIAHRSVVGKLPAWIEYMTAVDKAYGDFADDERGEDGANFMILSRRYEPNDTGTAIADASTYIDPEKFNYAFAYTKLDAQNFWVQIYSKIIARRYMSAKQIPNI